MKRCPGRKQHDWKYGGPMLWCRICGHQVHKDRKPVEYKEAKKQWKAQQRTG